MESDSNVTIIGHKRVDGKPHCSSWNSVLVNRELHKTYTTKASCKRPTLEIRNFLASLKYHAFGEAIFTDLLMSKKERFTKGNLEIYKNYLKKLMTYLEDWKKAQILRSKRDGRSDKTGFLAHETYRNARQAIWGFFHGCTYILSYLPEELQGFWYVMMLTDNTTPLESVYSVVRLNDKDYPDLYSGEVSDKTDRAMFAAIGTGNSSYDENDMVVLDFEDRKHSGSGLVKSVRKKIDQIEQGWRANFGTHVLTAEETPSRFGTEPIHKSELLESLAETMSEPSLGHSSFIHALMEEQVWIGRFRISTRSETNMLWFQNTLTTNMDAFNKICQKVMRELFTMLERSIHGLSSSFEKAFFDYLIGDDFKKLYNEDLPVSLRGNRGCAIYLVESLKMIFENWFAEAVIKLTEKHRDALTDDKSRAEIDVHSESFIMQVQNIVGGAISTLSRNKKLCSPDKKVESLRLIEKIRFGMYSDKIDEEYKQKYLPQLLQHCNNGGLSLIQAPFFPFAQSLMKTCVEASRKRLGYKMEITWISKGMIAVETSEELLSQFQKVVLTQMGDSFDLDLIKMFYQRIAMYSFRAFAKFTDKQDHKSTSSATSLSNIELRKLIACGASEGKNTKKKKEFNERKRDWKCMLKEMEPTKPESSPIPKSVPSELARSASVSTGQEVTLPTQIDQPPAAKKRRKNRTTEEIKDEYRSIYASALNRYDELGGDLSKLRTDYCCSVLFVAFDNYQPKSSKAKEVKPVLRNAILGNPNWRVQGQQ